MEIGNIFDTRSHEREMAKGEGDPIKYGNIFTAA